MLRSIAECEKVLRSPESSLTDKYDVVYHLRSWKCEEALTVLRDTYDCLGKSELLEHEVMYIFGQTISESSLDFLFKILNSPTEAPVVRHEAGEALGNYVLFKDRIIPELLKYWDSDISVLKSTVRLAVRKLENFNESNNNYDKYLQGTIEPAEPFNEEQLAEYLTKREKSNSDLPDILIDENVEEYIKYRIMYTLRAKGDKDSAVILSKLLLSINHSKTTPLMRHEVCFIMGQLDEKAKFDEVRIAIQENLENPNEDPIVRHEAILAYSQIWGIDEVIKKQREDPAPLVHESAQIVMN
jgi:deoxyhypusine monooxygenase